MRDPHYIQLETSWLDVVRNVCKSVPGDGDVLCCECMDPLFNDYEALFKTWKEVRSEYDSINIVHPVKNYFLDQNHQPIGFGFGHWFKYSQYLPSIYQLSWSTQIMTRKSIETCGFLVGERPYWFEAYNPLLDIDTEKDWELAQILYRYYREHPEQLENK